jgi:hypothetical protein
LSLNKLSVGQKIVLPLIFFAVMLALMLALEYLDDGQMFIAEQIALAAFHLFALAGIVSLIVWASAGVAYAFFRLSDRKNWHILSLAVLGVFSALTYLVDSMRVGAGNMIWNDLTGNYQLALAHSGAVWILSNAAGWAAAITLIIWLGFIYWPKKIPNTPA